MTHTVIEKMARAMWEANVASCSKLGIELDPWEDEREELRNDWRALSRAALLALRDSVDHSTPVTAQIVRAYVDGVLGEGKSLD